MSALLLAGYGYERAPSSRDFAVELAVEEETGAQLHLILAAEGPASIQPSLPRGKEPLVLLALLQMLMKKRGDLAGRVSYMPIDVLKLLGWGNTAKEREIFAEALIKYFHVFYQLSGNVEQPGREESDSTCKLRIISCHGFSNADGSKGRKRTPDFITFSLDFIEHLRKRKLLGIDWERVKRLTPLPADFFNL